MGLDGDRDDYGLPKVDIVVPDDARELDRDVIAYHREQRQRKRRARWRRLGRPFARYGIAAPFIASAVLIALISGVLMTVVSPRPAPRPSQVTPTGPTRLRPGQVGGVLPTGSLIVDGKRTPLADLAGPGVFLIVPQGCACAGAVGELVRQAGQLSGGEIIQVWLVADGRSGKAADDVRALIGPAAQRFAKVAEDPDRLLSRTYTANGLTAVLVHTDLVVGNVVRKISQGTELRGKLGDLHNPGLAPSAGH